MSNQAIQEQVQSTPVLASKGLQLIAAFALGATILFAAAFASAIAFASAAALVCLFKRVRWRLDSLMRAPSPSSVLRFVMAGGGRAPLSDDPVPWMSAKAGAESARQRCDPTSVE